MGRPLELILYAWVQSIYIIPSDYRIYTDALLSLTFIGDMASEKMIIWLKNRILCTWSSILKSSYTRILEQTEANLSWLPAFSFCYNSNSKVLSVFLISKEKNIAMDLYPLS